MGKWTVILAVWLATGYAVGAGVNGMCGTWAWYFQLAATLAGMMLTTFIPCAGLDDSQATQ